MIQLQKIFKWVNSGSNRTFLLKDINLEIAEGEFVSIMGPSGSGKSTLLNVIGMLDEANEGEYNFLKEKVNKFSGYFAAVQRHTHSVPAKRGDHSCRIAQQ